MSVASAHYSGSAYEQTEQSESGDVHATRTSDPGRRRAGVAQAEPDRIPAHMATGEPPDGSTAGARRRHGEIVRQRNDRRGFATSSQTPGFTCDEEHDGRQGGSVECQGYREGSNGEDPHIEENDRHCKSRNGDDTLNDADDDEADAKSLGCEQPRPSCSAASDRHTSKTLTDPARHERR